MSIRWWFRIHRDVLLIAAFYCNYIVSATLSCHLSSVLVVVFYIVICAAKSHCTWFLCHLLIWGSRYVCLVLFAQLSVTVLVSCAICTAMNHCVSCAICTRKNYCMCYFVLFVELRITVCLSCVICTDKCYGTCVICTNNTHATCRLCYLYI